MLKVIYVKINTNKIKMMLFKKFVVFTMTPENIKLKTLEMIFEPNLKF